MKRIPSPCFGLRPLAISLACAIIATAPAAQIGREVSIRRHLQDGEEYTIGAAELIEYGGSLLSANWTIQEGGGRPLTKGTGAPLSDPSQPLVFPHNFNRISAPDANSCAGCHNAPFGVPGGGGDIVANVFVLGQRFDFATFSPAGTLGAQNFLDERGQPVGLQSIANSRATLGMFGSGYIELLAREITTELRAIRDGIPPGGSALLLSKGIQFGVLSREQDGSWNTTSVEGLPAPSLRSAGPSSPPSLIIMPFHQAGAVISLRQFSNNAFNHHHGIQSTERFGVNTDPDGDGFVNELSRADITAATLFQAIMAVPGRVIPNDPEIENAIYNGEQLFDAIGCVRCHTPALPLRSTLFTEPNPYNPPGNLRPGDAPTLGIDLNDSRLPSPRLKTEKSGWVYVPAYTDLKLHDICDGPGDPNAELLDMQEAAGSPLFFGGNRRFLTRKLWGVANEPPFFHHGLFTTMRQAIQAHGGEAADTRAAFAHLSANDQGCVIEFLKTLQVLPPGTKHAIIDERGHEKKWPPSSATKGPKTKSKTKSQK